MVSGDRRVRRVMLIVDWRDSHAGTRKENRNSELRTDQTWVVRMLEKDDKNTTVVYADMEYALQLPRCRVLLMKEWKSWLV